MKISGVEAILFEIPYRNPLKRHLRLLVDECAGHHNEHRPHRSLGQRCPDGAGVPEPPAADGPSRAIRRDRRGGLTHKYAQVAYG
ncbi:hypothetical protein ACIHCV_41605 [Streptomyces sp. NPDC051956]|uniref:hypothetical protein n=1 Tax=Streptomyces sp. NPDC051956 TaxID=3365677 RepID=UPI0037CF7BEB